MSEKIHFVEMEGRNFMRLKLWQVRFEKGAGLVRVTGKNEQGKTSLLRAAMALLGGGKLVPGVAVNTEAGDEPSYIKGLLSNGFRVERRFNNSAPNGILHVVDSDGGKHGQGKLDEWVGPYSFAPLAMLSLSPAEVRELMLDLSDDPLLGAKLDELDEKRAELYNERTPYISQVNNANKVVPPKDPRPEPVDVSADSERLEHLREVEKGQEKQRETLADQKAALREIDEGIARLEERLQKAREMKEDKERAIADQMALVAQFEDHRGEIAEIKTRLAAANETSAVLERWRRYDAAMEALEVARERRDELTRYINDVDREKTELLAKAGPGIDGLTFDVETGAVLYKGIPFPEQASGAQKIEVAVQVALKADPDLGLALLDEANDMDLDALERLDQLAVEHDFQVWACRIGLEGEGEIVVVDGVASNREGGSMS